MIDSAANVQTVTTYLNWIKNGHAERRRSSAWAGAARRSARRRPRSSSRGTGCTRTCSRLPGVRFRVYPMIRNKQHGNLAFTVSYSMGKYSPNKAAAWTLLRYLPVGAGQACGVEDSGFLPSRSDVKAPSGRADFIKEAPCRSAVAVRQRLGPVDTTSREGAGEGLRGRPDGRADAAEHRPADQGDPGS